MWLYEVRVVEPCRSLSTMALPFRCAPQRRPLARRCAPKKPSVSGILLHPSLGGEIVTSMRVTIQRNLPVWLKQMVLSGLPCVARPFQMRWQRPRSGFAGLDVVEPGAAKTTRLTPRIGHW